MAYITLQKFPRGSPQEQESSHLPPPPPLGRSKSQPPLVRSFNPTHPDLRQHSCDQFNRISHNSILHSQQFNPPFQIIPQITPERLQSFLFQLTVRMNYSRETLHSIPHHYSIHISRDEGIFRILSRTTTNNSFADQIQETHTVIASFTPITTHNLPRDQ